MRQRILIPSSIVVLLLISIVPLTVSSSDAVISNDITWSENQTLTGNVTIAEGALLTISPGVTIDGGEGHTIEVAGSLNAQGVHFFSSAPPQSQTSHGVGLWQGIVVTSTGSAVLSDVIIENTNAGVRSDGDLTIENLTVIDSYIGINNFGTANVDQYSTEAIDNEAILNSGTITLNNGSINNSAIGISSTGSAIIEDSQFSNVGVALAASLGDLTAKNLTLASASVGLATNYGVQFQASEIQSSNVSLLADLSNADDFSLTDVQAEGNQLIKSNSATGVQISNIDFTGSIDINLPVIEQDCDGNCSIEDLTITNAKYGILLTGLGAHQIISSSVFGQQYALRSSEEGHLTISNSSFTSDGAGIITRDTNTVIIGDVVSTTTSRQSIAVDIIGGIHIWDNLSTSKSYDSGDFHSIGCKAWYTTITVSSLQASNFSTGILVQESDLTAEDITSKGGQNNGIELLNGHLMANHLETKFQSTGMVMTQTSQATIYQWIAELHDIPLQVDSFSAAYVLDLATINSNPAYSDASGQGALYYGSTANLVITTATSQEFLLTTIQITDMSGNAIEAEVIVNTFQMESDENGEVLLPLFSDGSLVTASIYGTGVSKLLNGAVQGQSIQVPVIPSGDWIISSNSSITIQSDTGLQELTGDLILEDNAVLSIDNTLLVLQTGATITISDNASIIGTNAVITADTITITDAGYISALDSQFSTTINANVSWSCDGDLEVDRIILKLDLSLSPNCNLQINNGEFNGQSTIPASSSLNVTSSLHISVIDRGNPLQGALIEYQGVSYSTDLSGEVVIQAIARQVNNQQDYTGSVETVLLSYNSYNEIISWDTSKPKSHQFIVSNIDVNEINLGNIILDSVWSPYYLDSDWVVPQGHSLTISSNVVLRVSDGVSITVDGVLKAHQATISSTGLGDRWAGVVLGASEFSAIELSSTNILEASPALSIFESGTFIGHDMVFARSLSTDPLISFSATSNASFSLANSRLSDAGSGCINAEQTSITLTIVDVILERCGGPAIRAGQTNLAISNITIGSGSSAGLVLTSVTGELTGLFGTEFDGAGSLLKLDYINQEFIVKNITGKVGESPGIAGSNNRALNLQGVELTGAPAIDFDYSSGTLSDITLYGQGTGTGLISHHGRFSDNLALSNIEITGYNVGIDLHADGVDTVSRMSIENSVIDCSTAISVENYPLSLSQTSVIGSIDYSGATSLQIYDSTFSINENISLWDGAIVEVFVTVNLVSQFDNAVKQGDYSVVSDYSDGSKISSSVSGQSPSLDILIFTTDVAGNEKSLVSITVEAASAGHPIQTQTLELNTYDELSQSIMFELQTNSAPLFTIDSPNSTSIIMQQTEFFSIISATDDLDSSTELSYTWTILDDAGAQIYSFTSNNSTHFMTINAPGSHILQIGVVDTLGAETEQFVPLDVKLLDSDRDLISSCDENNWFDLANSRSCGPDVYDDDDDNDGFIDTRDKWPLDPCVWQDTDNDGAPDNINCPDGQTTDLFEDQDDDGDGVPDILEGKSDNNGGFDSMTLILLVLSAVGILLFIGRMRKGMQE